jgi:AcrR family transcriptional regulator
MASIKSTSRPAGAQPARRPARKRVPTSVRRRRKPADAAAEILAATAEQLEERPLHELTVGGIMAATSLTREAFYVYFRDIEDAVTKLVEPVRDEARDLSEIWANSTLDPMADAHMALTGFADHFRKYGRLLRALSDAAARSPRANAVWHGVIDPPLVVVIQKIRREMELGRISDIEPERVAVALQAMNIRYLFEQVADKPDPDVEQVVQTLLQVWSRVLYKDDPENLEWARPPANAPR